MRKKGIVSNDDGKYRLKGQGIIIKIVDDLANKNANGVNAGNEQINEGVSEISEPVNATVPRWSMKLVKESLAEGNGQINKITEAIVEERKHTDSVVMQQAKTIDDLSVSYG